MIEMLRPFGDHLQVGFGQKNAASKINSYHPHKHTLIEGDPLILEKAENWLEEHPDVVLIADIWQNALPPLGLYDTIYCELSEIGGGIWPELTRIRYSDHDLETFCEGTALSAPDQLFRFLHELTHNGQITHEQLNQMVKRYKLEGPIPKLKKSCRQMVACLKVCLDSHMRHGSRFAAPLDDLSIAYDDPLFMQIAVDPFVEIHDCGEGIVVEKFGP